jgi:hypothetical protein
MLGSVLSSRKSAKSIRALIALTDEVSAGLGKKKIRSSRRRPARSEAERE